MCGTGRLYGPACSAGRRHAKQPRREGVHSGQRMCVCACVCVCGDLCYVVIYGKNYLLQQIAGEEEANEHVMLNLLAVHLPVLLSCAGDGG